MEDFDWGFHKTKTSKDSIITVGKIKWWIAHPTEIIFNDINVMKAPVYTLFTSLIVSGSGDGGITLYNISKKIFCKILDYNDNYKILVGRISMSWILGINMILC